MTGAEALAYIARMAPIWRSRPPSGNYVLHWLPRGCWCDKHGPVTKYHYCNLDDEEENGTYRPVTARPHRLFGAAKPR